MSFSALNRAANTEIHGASQPSLMSPIELFAAETKHTLQQVALEDRRALSAVAAYCRSSRRRINASKCETIVMRDHDDVAIADVYIRIEDEVVPEKQSVRYFGAAALFGAQDIMPCSPWMAQTRIWRYRDGGAEGGRHVNGLVRFVFEKVVDCAVVGTPYKAKHGLYDEEALAGPISVSSSDLEIAVHRYWCTASGAPRTKGARSAWKCELLGGTSRPLSAQTITSGS